VLRRADYEAADSDLRADIAPSAAAAREMAAPIPFARFVFEFEVHKSRCTYEKIAPITFFWTPVENH
jgi:hypothetical protein